MNREGLGGHNMIGKLETYLIVTLVTVLVWLYAEAMNSKEDSIHIRVQLVAPAGEKMIVQPDRPQSAVMTFKCATSSVETVRRMASGIFPITVGQRIDGTDVRDEEVDLLDWFKMYKELADLGVSIQDVKLTQTGQHVLSARIEPFVPLQRNIVVDAGAANLDVLAVKPEQATLYLRAGLVKRVLDEDVKAIALLDQDRLSQFDVNIEATDPRVALVLPEFLRGEEIQITPSQAEVTFTIRKQTEEHILESVPIQIMAPLAAVGGYRVEPKEELFIQNVRLSGPRDLVSDIREGKREVWAYLPLSAEELDSGIETKTVAFFVPAGVTVVDPAPGTLVVEFTITRESQIIPDPGG